MDHSDIVTRQFGAVADNYRTSQDHAQGNDLLRLPGILSEVGGNKKVLDLGCGAGHASFAAALVADEVCAYDLSSEMLAVVKKTASSKGLTNIWTKHGYAEKLPFSAACFDAVISRMSAHHWRNLPHALAEAHRVLVPGGLMVMIDVVGHEDPLFDTHLQSVELLRDRSHVRDYSPQQWLSFFEAASFFVKHCERWRIPIEFSAWTARIRTPTEACALILQLWQNAPKEIRDYYAVQEDGSFELELQMWIAYRV